MLRALTASFAFFLALLLSACGDGDSGAAMGSLGPTATAQSNVVKGLIRNGVVRALRWRNGVYVEVASARTGADGSFTLTLPDPVAGEVLRLELALAGDGSTQMQCDVADCGFAARGNWGTLTSDFGLASWASVADDGSVTVMPVTPVSTLLVRYAENLGGGHLTAVAVAAARQRVASLFNMSPADLLVRPGSVVDGTWMAGATPQAIKLSLLSAAFAQLAATSSASIEGVVDAYATAFADNSGHLVQDGASQSLGNLFRSLQTVLATGVEPTALQSWMTGWASNFLSALQANQLNLVSCDGSCPDFNTADLISALGTGADTLGGDLTKVMAEKNVSRIEQLVAGELAKFGWLMTPDTLAVAKVVGQIVGYALVATMGTQPAEADGLVPTLSSGVLHVTGTHTNGMTVDVSVTLAPLLALIQGYDPEGDPPLFTYSATGTVENANVRAIIDGSFTLDPMDTDLSELRDVVNTMIAGILTGNPLALENGMQALMSAAADLIRTGEATLSLQGSAGIAKLGLVDGQVTETSRLAIQGKGWMQVDMNGGEGDAIAANGAAEFGTLTLPNGDYFVIDPTKDHALEFALGTDGTASASFAANVLSHAAAVSGSGSIGNLGSLLSNLRDVIAAQLEADTATASLDAILLQLLTGLGSLTLSVEGQAVIPDLGHTYTLSIADGHLRLSQPNSEEIAIDVSIAGSELLVQAGGKWWLFGLNLQSYDYPTLMIADSSGGEWSFDLATLLAAN